MVAISHHYVSSPLALMTGSEISKAVLQRTKWTLVARELALRTSAVIGIPTYAAHIVLGHVPAPCSDSAPSLDLDLHGG